MELDLFQFIEQTMAIYDLRLASFTYAETVLKRFVSMLYQNQATKIVNVYSRVKSRNSLKEKLLRNRFYLNYEKPEDALEALSDLVGITIECRFISEEKEIFNILKNNFHPVEDSVYYASDTYKDIYLNLSAPQPQIQRNGFTIYRVDGQFQFNGETIGFELQIKSLVHRFWSEIEHEVVYKNDENVSNDRFMKSLLTSIRDNLDVVDRQLELVYEEMLAEGKDTRIGMDEKSFKSLASSSINELFITKMKENVGFSTYFRRDAEMIAQYIYIRHFLNGKNTEMRMVNFLEDLNLLSQQEVDFKTPVSCSDETSSFDPFISQLYRYFVTMLNKDFEWHAFFIILQMIEKDEMEVIITNFTSVLRRLCIQQTWFETTFSSFEANEQSEIQTYYLDTFACALTKVNSTKIVHEQYVLSLADYFYQTIDKAEKSMDSYESFLSKKEAIKNRMEHEILWIFQS